MNKSSTKRKSGSDPPKTWHLQTRRRLNQVSRRKCL